MKWDRIAAMNRARDRKPASGGKNYKRLAVRRETPAMGTWDRLTGITMARWECAREDAIAQFQFECHGDDWEGL
jgi:hypothetical protein